jgi:hypothetical protein
MYGGENMKDCCSPNEENQKKEVQPQVQESCCTPREEERKRETMKEKKHDRGCGC